MGASGKNGVPYLKKVDSPKVADITTGVCFCFGDNCNVVYYNGKEIGRLEYVGKHGPDLKFKIAGKKGCVPGDMEDKYVELLNDKGISVPLME